MISVRPFQAKDIQSIDPRSDKVMVDHVNWASFEDDPNVKIFTLLKGTEPVMVFGATLMNSALPHYEAFAVVDKDASNYPFRVVRTLIRVLQATSNSFQRLQITVDSEDSTAQKFAKLLGFEGEGYLRCNGPNGEDHILYSRIGRVWIR